MNRTWRQIHLWNRSILQCIHSSFNIFRQGHIRLEVVCAYVVKSLIWEIEARIFQITHPPKSLCLLFRLHFHWKCMVFIMISISQPWRIPNFCIFIKWFKQKTLSYPCMCRSKKGESLLSMAHSVLNRQGSFSLGADWKSFSALSAVIRWRHWFWLSAGGAVWAGFVLEALVAILRWLFLNPVPSSWNTPYHVPHPRQSWDHHFILLLTVNVCKRRELQMRRRWSWKNCCFFSIPKHPIPVTHVPLALTKRWNCSRSRESRAVPQEKQASSWGGPGTGRDSILPHRAQPHSTSGYPAGQGWGPLQAQESQRTQEQTWKRQSSGAGPRVPIPQLEERSGPKKWVLPSLCPPAACLALGMQGCCSLHSNDVNLPKPVTAWPSQAIYGKAVLLFAKVSH